MPKRTKPYRSKVKIGVDADGKPVVKYIQGYTRDELDRARRAVIAVYITGEALSDDRLFGDYATEWFRVRKAPFTSPSSKQSYRTALNKDTLPVFGDRNLRAISAIELQGFVNRFKGRSGTKITVILATLRGIFASAKADRLIANDPTEALMRPSATKAKPKPVLTQAQRQAIADVCATHVAGHYLALMYYLGCRPGEARGLMWRDIDWKTQRAHIQRDIDYKAGGAAGELKTEASDREVPIPAPLLAILAPLRSLPDTYIAHGEDAGKPLSKTSAERLWVELMQAAELVTPADPNHYRAGDPRSKWSPVITPHALRHNFITMCWENSLEPFETMKLVGHTSITTTLNIYTHLSEAQMQKTAAKLDSMFITQTGAKKAIP